MQIFARDGQIKITGMSKNVSRAAGVIQQLQRAIRHNHKISPAAVSEAVARAAAADKGASDIGLDVYGDSLIVRPKTPGQKRYIEVKARANGNQDAPLRPDMGQVRQHLPQFALGDSEHSRGLGGPQGQAVGEIEPRTLGARLRLLLAHG